MTKFCGQGRLCGYADEALTAFLASQGVPAWQAGNLIDEVSFTELRFRQLLAGDGTTQQLPGPGPDQGAS